MMAAFKLRLKQRLMLYGIFGLGGLYVTLPILRPLHKKATLKFKQQRNHRLRTSLEVFSI